MKMLAARWLLYSQAHDDHLACDWEGYERQAGETWIQAKFRGRGYVQATNSSIPFGQRRPTAHSMLVGETVDGYTAMLLGTGRQPALKFLGDSDSTEAISALFRYSDFWPTMSEARKLSGAMGAGAVLPEVREGKLTLRTLRPEHLYIEWSTAAAWIPDLVIEQKRVTVERMGDSGKVEIIEVWRTRAWDSEHSYAYKDAPVVQVDDSDGQREADIELEEAPLPHHAGRCPVIWLQNTVDSDDPYGEADCETIFEQVEQLDRSQSMVMRGSRANNDPTLVVADTMSARTRWPKRAKGYGRSIELSEKGEAKLLESNGTAIESSWSSIRQLEDRARARVGRISPNPENAGSYQSGVALQILHRTETSRAGERRNPLGVAICQLAQTVYTICKKLGIRTYGAAPKKGAIIELPPRELPREDDEDRDEIEFDDHVLGTGGIVELSWPKFHEPIPEEVRTVADALGKLRATQAISQETSVAYALKVLQSDTDVATEIDRIRKEREASVADLDRAMMPDVDDDDDLGAEQDADVEVDSDAKPVAAGEQVQHEAMNGIQVKTLGDVLARTGRDLTPLAAKFTIIEGFPGTASPERQALLDAAIESQRVAAEKEPPVAAPTAPPAE